jgi:type I restriction enzyme S subunit
MGSTHQTIYMPDVAMFSTPVPPDREQDEIVAFVRSETARIDALMAKVREAINHLEELRTALISAAVTGKIDVRDTALRRARRRPALARGSSIKRLTRNT